MIYRREEQLRQSRTNALWRSERNRVLRTLDPVQMEHLLLRWRHPLPAMWSTDKRDGKLACMHYARLQVPDMTADEKVTSAKWLMANAYSLPSGFGLEGDVLTFTTPNVEGPNFGMEDVDAVPAENVRRVQAATDAGLLPYIFFRENGMWAPFEHGTPEEAVANAAANDFVRVETIDGTIIWEKGDEEDTPRKST